MSLIKGIIFFWDIVKDNGLSWVVRRGLYEVQIRSGWRKSRFKKRPWREDELDYWLRDNVHLEPDAYFIRWHKEKPAFFFDAGDIAANREILRQVCDEGNAKRLCDEANAVRKGQIVYFNRTEGNIGYPPCWHENPFTGQKVDPLSHWMDYPIFSKASGDFKYLWEPGRFSYAYLLARAYMVTSDETYADTFWTIFDDWYEKNPPNTGPQWKCGQETSFRVMAWCFALYAFAECETTTAERVYRMVGAIAAQAERVSKDTVYAQLQHNNHSISEAVGLWTVGVLFPELKLAAKWKKQGRSILEREAQRLIYEDGSFCQDSNNYHRLMLHDYIYAIRLGEVNGEKFSSGLRVRVDLAGRFIIKMLDCESGQVPNTGPNDGALILPLNLCDYTDYRPVCSSIYYLFNAKRLLPNGPWDEELVWLFGVESLTKELDPAYLNESLKAEFGGYFTFRGEGSWGLLRGVAKGKRPSEADCLHFDLWKSGSNIARDPGSYLYFADSPWNNGLVGTSSHNTVTIDNLDQMKRGPRFMWLGWLKTRLNRQALSKAGSIEYFELEHDGYMRLADPVIHRRGVLRLPNDSWIVVDDIVGAVTHSAQLNWLVLGEEFQIGFEDRSVVFSDLDYGLRIFGDSAGAFSALTGTESSAPRGWYSLYYGEKSPGLSVSFDLTAGETMRIVTLFAPSQTLQQWNMQGYQLSLDNDFAQIHVDFQEPGIAGMLMSVNTSCNGVDDLLEI